jgi:hypothetical protein
LKPRRPRTYEMDSNHGPLAESDAVLARHAM